MAEYMQISRQRCRVARDIHYPGNGMFYQGIQHDLLAAGPWRINDQSIDLRGQLRQHILHFPLEDLDVAHLAQVPLGILDGARRLLDSDDLLNMPGQR